MIWPQKHSRMCQLYYRPDNNLNERYLPDRIIKEGFSRQQIQRGFQPVGLSHAGQDLEAKFQDGFTEPDTTVGYIDIENFSQKVRGFSAVDIRSFLQNYYEIAVGIIDEQFGVIEKCIGDGIVFCVGRPFYNFSVSQQKEHAFELCTTVIQECDAQMELDIRAAVAHGEAFFGYIGSKPYEEPMVVGDVLTRAFRLESVGRAREVTIIHCFNSVIPPRNGGNLQQAAEDFASLGWKYEVGAQERLEGIGNITKGVLRQYDIEETIKTLLNG